MRASRLLSILTTLQAKGHATAQALADEFEVSLRTIYRVRLNGMSAKEAEALFLAGLTREATELGLGAVTASARNKLLAALPEELRSGAMKARFHFDAPAWFAESETLAYLPRVADAMWNQHPIRMRYQSRKSATERRVEPLGIVLKGGAWYLVGQVGGDARTYRISRITEMEVEDGRFPYPETFDLEAYWTESLRRYEVDLHPNAAEIRLSPQGLDRMEAFLPTYIRKEAVVSKQADARGWHNVTLSVGSMAQAAPELLRFGTDAEVIGPPELRAEMAMIVDALARLYASDQPATPEPIPA